MNDDRPVVPFNPGAEGVPYAPVLQSLALPALLLISSIPKRERYWEPMTSEKPARRLPRIFSFSRPSRRLCLRRQSAVRLTVPEFSHPTS
jgi:hypothetical protein